MVVSTAKGLTPFGPSSIETFSGIEIDLLQPQPFSFTIEDIAVGLGNLCRFSGQVRRFYSVAEHSVLVCDLLGLMGRPDLRGAGLLHDPRQAYTGHMTAPVKHVIRMNTHHTLRREPIPFDQMVQRIERAINDRFGIEIAPEDHAVIKAADYQALRIEAAGLCRSKGDYWNWPAEALKYPPDGIEWKGGLLPMEAAMLFEQRWESMQ